MARLLANPVSPVWFAGWKSDTHTLGMRGWDLAFNESLHDRQIELLLYHAESDIKMLAVAKVNPLRERQARIYASQYMQGFGSERYGFDGPEFHVVRAWQGKGIRQVIPSFPAFKDWADTRPKMIEADERDIMDLPIFLARTAPVAEQIIVEPQDVQQLLDQIKRMQSPEQEQIRRRTAREAPRAQATILSFGT